MSLTKGHGPLAPEPGGERNYTLDGPAHRLWFEPSPRRVRAVFGGETVADSRRARLLHETGLLPVYYFPRDDVRMDLLEPIERSTHCPFKGDASYWTVRAGGRVAEAAVWGYPEPLEGAPGLADYLAFDWGSMDAWYEEDEEVSIHPRDPYTRVDALESSRRVRIVVDGAEVALSERPVLVFETGLPVRWYLPREDVRTELLEESDTVTGCPYKGRASYYSLRTEDGFHQDLVWTYPEPLPAVEKIAGRLAFFDERVELEELDG